VLSGRDARAAVEVLDTVADALGIAVELVAAAPDGMHPTRTAGVLRGGVAVGVVGEVDPEVVDRMGLAGPVAWLELDIDAVAAGGVGQRTYRAVSRFPSADVDLAFELAEDTAASALRAAITDAAGELLVDLELFDVYRGEGVAEGSRSLAHRLRLQASDRTLTDAEVAEVRQRVVDHVATTLGASLR